MNEQEDRWSGLPQSDLAVVLVLALAGTAFATVASNFSPALQSRGTIENTFHYNTDGIKLETKGALDIVQATVSMARRARPAGTSTRASFS